MSANKANRPAARPERSVPPAAEKVAPSRKDDPRRQRLFWVVLLLLPLLFFMLLEAGLGLAGYGEKERLVLLRQDYGERYYQINRQVARRWFSGSAASLPDARDEAFAYKKEAATFRIFCLGGSTTAGWPYQHNAGFPSQLQVRLSHLFPDRQFEVINLGISAINSYSVLDITGEVLRYQPDLFLIYMGHNEFYGAFGVASTQRLGLSRGLIKTYMTVRHFKVVQLLRDGIGLFRRSAAASGEPRTLMENMVGDNKIALDSPKYQRARADFAANLDEILGKIRKAGVPVLVSTLTSNIADQPPFESLFTPGFTAMEQWRALVSRGDAAWAAGDPAAALQRYQEAAALDAMPADLAWKTGRCRRALGDSSGARQAFERARDLDALRFRASAEFNQVIRQVCAGRQVPVVETADHFAAAAPQGLVGQTLMLDHLHPNAAGYLLMADAFCGAMAAANLITSRDQWPRGRDLAPERLIEKACITPLEEELAYQRIRKLTSRYPFKAQRLLQASSEPDYDKVLKGAVQALMQRKWTWNEAHYRVADWLASRERYAEAAQEYRAVIRVVPGNYYPYLHLADMLNQQGKANEAEESLRQAAAMSPNLPFAFAKLGVQYMSRDDAGKAMPVLRKAIANAGNSREFSAMDLSRVHYLLGVALAQTGDYAGARQEAEIAQKLAPGQARVEKLLQDLAAVMK